jgi:glycosyltransferase involved in cell wall biosynthesis
MRILNLVAGQKWTGIAAVAFDQTAALVAEGVEAQFGFVGDSPLATRLHPLGWARPVLLPLRTPVDYVREARRLAAMLARERFDVIHAHASHDHWAAGAALAMAKSDRPIPLVRTIHNLRHARRTIATAALFERTRSFAFANREIAAAFGPGDAAAGPVHSPVIDAATFHPAVSPAEERRALGLPKEGFLAGTVGKMAEGRGHREAIAAGASVPGVTLVHVGHGELLPVMKDLAASLGAGNRNVFLGYQEEILPALSRAWDAFVFPASGSEQGQRAILEAMASGVPVVAVSVPGVADLMTDGIEGYVVGSGAEIGPALARLAADPGLRAGMGARGRRRALEFTAEKFAAKAIPFYEEALKG